MQPAVVFPIASPVTVSVLFVGLVLGCSDHGPAGIGEDDGSTPALMNQVVFWSTEGGSKIFVMNTDGSAQTRLTERSLTQRDPAISPDGTRIAFVSDRDGTEDIFVMNADGSGVTNLTNDTAEDFAPSWSPDGTRILFTSDRDRPAEAVFPLDIFVMNTDGSDPVNLTPESTFHDQEAAWSPDGTQIAFSTNRVDGQSFDIFLMNADGSDPVRLTEGEDDFTRDEFTPAWSPDGGRIAYTAVCFCFFFDSVDIEVVDADGSNPVALTSGPADNSFPSWSPDGSRISFVSNRTGDDEVFVMNADGSSQTNLTNRPEFDDLPGTPQTWSP